jgi:hypothetical protein
MFTHTSKHDRTPLEINSQLLEGMLEYVSDSGIHIRAGTNAKENDALRDESNPAHFWFHVAERPGAHVVAETTELDRVTKRDAAVLAVYHSKVEKTQKMTVVDVCRLSQVSSKVKGPHGLVSLHGSDINELCVFQNKVTEKARLARLLITKSTVTRYC